MQKHLNLLTQENLIPLMTGDNLIQTLTFQVIFPSKKKKEKKKSIRFQMVILHVMVGTYKIHRINSHDFQEKEKKSEKLDAFTSHMREKLQKIGQ